MLIIHIISLVDTEQFSSIYKDIDANILINPSKKVAKKAIIEEKECIVLIGHGTEYGLLNPRLDGFIVDSSMVQFLRNKTVIGIWCFASNFADKYDLKGFFTSNFISNENECNYFYLTNMIDINYDISKIGEIIEQENIKFSNQINTYLKNRTPLSEWVDGLQNNCSDYPFVRYNYEALFYNE